MNYQDYLINSKCKMDRRGMNPNELFIFRNFLKDSQLKKKRERLVNYLESFQKISNEIFNSLKNTPVLIAVTDTIPVILDIYGDHNFIKYAQKVGIQPGTILEADSVGMNPSLASLELQRPIRLFGEEHYFRVMRNFVWYAVPIRDRNNTTILTVSLLTTVKNDNSFIMPLLLMIQKFVEKEYTCN